MNNRLLPLALRLLGSSHWMKEALCTNVCIIIQKKSGVSTPEIPRAGRDKIGEGNIGIHSRKEGRFICHVRGKTFSSRKGSVFYRLHYSVEFVAQIVTLLAHGCPPQAIVAAFGVDERTVSDWYRRAGRHRQQVHEHLVQPPRDLDQVQADEIRVKHQGDIAWLAMALQVSTRLWLGGGGRSPLEAATKLVSRPGETRSRVREKKGAINIAPPERTRVICIDEMGPIAVKTYPGEEWKMGPSRATFREYGRIDGSADRRS